jgi:2-keto-4-pentenoate hydratase/2-oxohepta-3-ene-1,7-dioic acid hydratase in catechol pathway
VFFKPPSAIVHDGATVRLPAEGGTAHHEVELVVVIGRAGTAIPRERALDHVAGYAVGLDLTLRDLQSQAKQRGEPWSLSKGFDGAAPVSLVVPRERVGDGSGLEISLDINGERRQSGNTSQMLWPVDALIELVSRWITLERGDLLFTGTPAGVGPLRPGDRLVATIGRVASLHVDIA